MSENYNILLNITKRSENVSCSEIVNAIKYWILKPTSTIMLSYEFVKMDNIKVHFTQFL